MIAPFTFGGFHKTGSSRHSKRTGFWQHVAMICMAAAVSGLTCPGPPGTVNEISLEMVADGLVSPVGMALPGDESGRLFVVDQIGTVRIVEPPGTLLPTPFLDVADRMVSLGIDFGDGLIFDERGLLSLAFHPDYAQNGRFFILYNAPKGPNEPELFDSQLHVSEFRVSNDANLADASTERILLVISKPQFNHNGGQLAFGPDGFLFISVGDGGGADDVDVGHTPDLGNGQDTSQLLGKILRIDVDQDEPFSVPDDNPFVEDADFRPEIWALGFRNPWRFSFDTQNDNRLFVADVGQNLFEEVNIVTAGGNYGWNIREGSRCFDPESPDAPPDTCPSVDADSRPLLNPILEYPHNDATGMSIGIAAVGGFVYRGRAIPSLAGQYLFGDWSTSFLAPDGSLFAAEEAVDGTWVRRELFVAGEPDGRIGRYVLGFGQDADGEVYVLSTANVGPFGTTGRVDRIVPVAP